MFAHACTASCEQRRRPRWSCGRKPQRGARWGRSGLFGKQECVFGPSCRLLFPLVAALQAQIQDVEMRRGEATPTRSSGCSGLRTHADGVQTVTRSSSSREHRSGSHQDLVSSHQRRPFRQTTADWVNFWFRYLWAPVAPHSRCPCYDHNLGGSRLRD